MKSAIFMTTALLAAFSAVQAHATDPTPRLGSDQFAVAYQIDIGHTGAITFDKSFAPPLKMAWKKNISGVISYPLIAEGKVFVTVGQPNKRTSKLYALDETNGKTIWTLEVDSLSQGVGGFPSWANAAYDNGEIFVLNGFGLLRAVQAATGAVLWTTQLSGQFQFTVPPIAADGLVFTSAAGLGGTLYAVDQATGALRWTKDVASGDRLAMSYEDVAASNACSFEGFDPPTGNLRWNHSLGCSGGNNLMPVHYRGHVYARTDLSTGFVLDSNTGQVTGNFSASFTPALQGDVKYSATPATLTATAIDTGDTLWSFDGDGQMITPPLVINDSVYIASATGNIFVLDRLTGTSLATISLGIPIPGTGTAEGDFEAPLAAMGAGDGLLVVPAHNSLVAFKAN